MPHPQPSKLREQQKAPTRPRAPTAPLKPTEPTAPPNNMEQATLMTLLDHIGRLTGVVEKMSTNILVLNEDLRLTTQKVDELLARDHNSSAVEMTGQREGGMQGLGLPSDRSGVKKSKSEGRVDAEAGDDEDEDMWDDSELDEAAAEALLKKILRSEGNDKSKDLDGKIDGRSKEWPNTIPGSSQVTAHSQAAMVPARPQTQRDHVIESQPALKSISNIAARPSQPQRKMDPSTTANQPKHHVRPAQRASSTSAKSYSDWEGLSNSPVTAPPAKRARVTVNHPRLPLPAEKTEANTRFVNSVVGKSEHAVVQNALTHAEVSKPEQRPVSTDHEAAKGLVVGANNTHVAAETEDGRTEISRKERNQEKKRRRREEERKLVQAQKAAKHAKG
ncbi:hypothetical protein PMZ80_003526 [Knufia obscura]|uniref:Uncharacterized protein n=1 Tax=Knufia obscura TaxID=1635080 RepID=A0ABR0RUG5_9EURO|nr:hypothetical protein PMZ80_003526 [Knufia obscura]